MSHYTNNLFDPNAKNNQWLHLFEYVPKQSRVLDVGCSSGNFGDVLINEKHCEVIGIDIDEPDIELAQTKLTAAKVRNIERDDISELGTFDVIIFADVLEHLLDPIAALHKVKKQLRPNGRIVFSIPNMGHISVRLLLLKGFFEYISIGVLDRTHLHYYDEQEVQHLFAEAKLEIKEVHPHTWTYPKSKISEELYNMGLGIIDDKFYKTLDDTKAQVWQFVGYATPVAKKPVVGERPLHYRLPPEELSLALEARDKELQKLGQRLQELEAENAKLHHIYKHPVKSAARFIRKKIQPKTTPKSGKTKA